MSDNPTTHTQATQELVTQIVSGYVKRNQVAPADIATVINTVYQSLQALGRDPELQAQAPAVSIRQSVRQDYVVCLECGRRGNVLRRHIKAAHGLSPEQYRSKWQLLPGHPLTAPAYSAQRSAMAKRAGLGRRATPRRRRRSSQ